MKKRLFQNISILIPLSISYCHNDTNNTITSITNNNNLLEQQKKSSRLLFLGSGSSIGTPIAIHLMQEQLINSSTYQQFQVSLKASKGNPKDNKNYRCNPSLLIRHNYQTNSETNIIIDAGKTFRESIIRWFPDNQVNRIDAIILTHGHADAIFGLDDVRSLQPMDTSLPMPVYLTKDCYKIVERVFFYLFPLAIEGQVNRHVSSIDWRIFKNLQSFQIDSLPIIPFPVMHGEDLESTGFLIGSKEKLCYISDISRMIPSSLQLIIQNGPIELLVVDALAFSFRHPTHYSVEEAINLCRQVRPKKCLLIGMGSGIEYEEANKELKKYLEEGLDIQLAHDGLNIDIDL